MEALGNEADISVSGSSLTLKVVPYLTYWNMIDGCSIMLISVLNCIRTTYQLYENNVCLPKQQLYPLFICTQKMLRVISLCLHRHFMSMSFLLFSPSAFYCTKDCQKFRILQTYTSFPRISIVSSNIAKCSSICLLV